MTTSDAAAYDCKYFPYLNSFNLRHNQDTSRKPQNFPPEGSAYETFLTPGYHWPPRPLVEPTFVTTGGQRDINKHIEVGAWRGCHLDLLSL